MLQLLREEYTKIQQSKIFVNEEKRTVVCVLDTMLGTFKGKAVCSPNDTFDVSAGKKIAFNRAIIQANAYAKRTLKEEVLKNINIILSEIDYSTNKARADLKAEYERLDNLV